MKKGKTKFWNNAKGYGFVIDDESGEELYVHATYLIPANGRLVPDQKVLFDVRPGKKGNEAFNVEKV